MLPEIPTHEITPANLLALMHQRPMSLGEVARSRSAQSRRRRAAIAALGELEAQGLVRTIYMDGQRLHVPTGWRMSDEQVHLMLMGKARQVDGCMEWIGQIDGRGVPCFNLSPHYGRTDPPNILRPRRVLWNQCHREPLQLHEVVLPKCGNELCVDPAHMRRINRQALRSGPVQATHRLAITQGSRAASKLNMDAARAIRASDEPAKTLAERYGVTAANINLVRRNVTWREVTGNPFAGLMA